MKKIESLDIISKTGRLIGERWEDLGNQLKLPIKVTGLPALISFRLTSDNWLKYKTYIAQEMLKKGILAANSVYVSVAHKQEYIDGYFTTLEPLFKTIALCEADKENIDLLLEGPVCHDGFKRLI